MNKPSCPHCGARCLQHNLGPEEPQPGDAGMCEHCGGFVALTAQSELVKLESVVFEALPARIRAEMLISQREWRRDAEQIQNAGPKA